MKGLFSQAARLLALCGIVLAVSVGIVATPAAAAPSPVVDRSASGVTADALPTVQIDGVVWAQAIVGNTVYAGGEFANARPAGAPAGTSLVPRGNLLAYNLTTGALINSFAPTVNGVIRTIEASPDGSVLYIGGSFTSVDSQNRYRLAAFNTATGKLTSFAPVLDSSIYGLAVTASTVYAGGEFSIANGNARTRLAAFSTSSGALLRWAPTADSIVHALQLTPDGAHLIVGGAFANLNAAPAPGIGSLDVRTGTSVPFAVNTVVQDYGVNSAILSLTTDGSAIYGTGYRYHGGNFEGTFSVNPNTGAINWLADCHGDTYGSYAGPGQVYVVSHEHDCSNVNGFGQSNPETWQRTSAFTTQATGTVGTNHATNYANFAGQPSPSQVTWFPNLSPGSYTMQYQAAWTITGNGRYVIEGGEFPTVNGTPQQGLVRFAVPSLAPDKRGPMDTSSATSPSVTVTSPTTATISWTANWDQDNKVLTYRLLRGNTIVVNTTTAASRFWRRQVLSYRQTGLKAGTTYTYRVLTRDPDGNAVRSPPVTVTTPP